MNKLIEEELKRHLDNGDFRITVVIGEATFLCFPLFDSVDIYRLEGNLLTHHEREISPDLDCDEVELYCFQIEEQCAADNNK